MNGNSGKKPADMPRVIAVAMSGGVDSSVTACLLKEQGWSVIGMTMRLFSGSGATSRTDITGSEKAISDARAVCGKIGIEHHVVGCEEEFENRVIRPFVREYLDGRTPNPCVICNARIKFSFLLDKAFSLGAGFLATGHYVRLLDYSDAGKAPVLARALDKLKDQSYFLWSLDRKNLGRFRFPLGDYRKSRVRELAGHYGLDVSERPESQEACFIRHEGLQEFIRRYAAFSGNAAPPPNTRPGPVVDKQGAVLGSHQGSAFYTIGQRRGLGVALGYPAYVTSIDPVTNTVVVGLNEDLMSDIIEAASASFLNDPPPGPFKAQVKIRYKHHPVAARVIPLDRGRVRVEMDSPQRAVTPGQSVVFYDNEVLLGGAVIEKSSRSHSAQ